MSVTHSLGLAHDQVKISPYNADWPVQFDLEKPAIIKCVQDFQYRDVQHIGSTSIPGLCAKPIIDIAAAIPSFDHVETIKLNLAKLGYAHIPGRGTAFREFFAKGPEDCRTHYLHLTLCPSDEWNRLLRFRYRLHTSDSLRDEYAALKQQLAREFPTDRIAYNHAKAEFIEKCLL